jgi:hypothetical protein
MITERNNRLFNWATKWRVLFFNDNLGGIYKIKLCFYAVKYCLRYAFYHFTGMLHLLLNNGVEYFVIYGILQNILLYICFGRKANLYIYQKAGSYYLFFGIKPMVSIKLGAL